MNASGITLKQLRAIEAVASHKSITQAADALGLTPPAVHSQIRALEEYLGSPLVIKSAKSGMVLTAEGQLIRQAQKAIESSLNTCLFQISAMQKGLAGAVTLGVVSTGKYFAPALVAGLKKSFPDIEVALFIGNRDEIVTALHRRSVDLVVMGRPPRSPAVTARAIGDHPHLLIAAPDHRLVGQTSVGSQDILNEVIISRERGSGTRILMTRYLDRIGEGRPYETLIMTSNETIKQAVIAGLGIALISQHTVTEELKSGRLVAINFGELPINRQWFLLHRAEMQLSPAMGSVWKFICQNCDQYFPKLS
jgi:LysR family transcriptional regulator, low CO2-responsive transcriptional regulator